MAVIKRRTDIDIPLGFRHLLSLWINGRYLAHFPISSLIVKDIDIKLFDEINGDGIEIE